MDEEETKINTARGHTYNEVALSMGKRLEAMNVWVGGQYQDSVRNLAIISGSIASFSMLLIGSGVIGVADGALFVILISGVAFFLLETLLAFVHLFVRHSADFLMIRRIRDTAFKPFQQMADDWIKFRRGRITAEEWSRREREFLASYDNMQSELTDSGEKANKLNYFDYLLAALFILATSLIIVALVLKGLTPWLSDFLYGVTYTNH